MDSDIIFLLFIFLLASIFVLLLTFKSFRKDVNRKQNLILKKIDDLINDIDDLKSSVNKPVRAEKEKELKSKIEDVLQESTTTADTTKNELLETKNESINNTAENEPTKSKFATANNDHDIHLSDNKLYELDKVSSSTVSTESKDRNKAVTTKKKTDFEKFIGENLLNKIGIITLILSLVFFGKYAVEQGWLSNAAKVIAIVAVGGVLIGIAHKLRKTYKAFSSVLAGGGIAALYIAITIGYQLYGMFGQTLAFIFLVIITALAVLLSLTYDKRELAVFAILGGFATPLLVSTGEGNYKVLFTYIAILDIGMLILSYYKRWNIVYFVANFATIILYAAWIINDSNNELPHLGAFLFATAFYIIFFLMNIINNVKENSKFTGFEFITLISNSFLYFIAGFYIVNEFNPNYRGLFTFSIAVFNFVFAFLLYNKQHIDRNLIFLLIGVGLSFVSLAIPVQFAGKYITMLWAVESVLLIWLYQKSGMKLLRNASFIISIAAYISLIINWFQIYDFTNNITKLPIIINEGFIVGIVSMISFSLIILLLNKDSHYDKNNFIKGIYVVGLLLMSYIVALLEIIYQVGMYYNNNNLTIIAIAFFSYLYLAVVIFVLSHSKYKTIFFFVFVISAMSLFVYIIDVLPEYRMIIEDYIGLKISHTFSLLHFATSFITLTIGYLLWRSARNIFTDNKFAQKYVLWFVVIIGVVILSIDLEHIILLAKMPQIDYINEELKQIHLIHWSILWGVLAFALMITGMKRKDKTFRIIGISLFFFTILKLFALDVWQMSAGGRVAAFASLAVLLLLISFLYQKLKKIIFNDDNEK